jgi:mono/diheme cytochrome c family protein
MKKVFKVLGILILVAIIGIVATGFYVKKALPDVGPPPDLEVEQTPERIERGRYLAHHVAVCMDCHSIRDWSQFAGPPVPGNLGGGGEVFDHNMGFPGTFYSRNITPAALKDWTDGEIYRAITCGVSKDGSPLFPIMPYTHYGQMDPEDIYSIIAYIRTLEPVEKTIPAPAPDFPINFLIHTMPVKGTPGKCPPPADQVNYGRYLVNASGCVECHSRQENGQVVAGTEFGGGMEFRQPGGIMRSPNITPDMETGIGSWSSEAFVKRFKAYTDSNYRSEVYTPEDLNSPMPWTMYAGMTEQDLAAIYAYLRTVKPISHNVVRMEKKQKS